MATNYPNISGAVMPDRVEHRYPSEDTTIFWNGASIQVYFLSGTAITADTSSDLSFLPWYYTNSPETKKFISKGSSGTITVEAGRYITISESYSADEAGNKDDRSQSVFYTLTPCTITWTSEHYQDAVYNYSFYLTSGNIDKFYLVKNDTPIAPSNISVPSTINGGKNATISWSTATDPDGKIGGYELERQWDGTGSWTQIYKGSKTTYSDPIPKGEHTSVAYRVRAYDEYDTYSSYTTSATRTIINNAAPTTPEWCSVPNPVKGGTSIKITWPASTDSDGNLSGYILERKFNSNSWTQIYKGTNRSYTDPIPLDKYKTVTYRVKAYDTKNAQSAYATSATRTIQNSTVLQFRLKAPIESAKRAAYGQEIMTYTIPSGATFKAEACNNGFDENPTWEDVTEFVKKQKIFEFANKTKTASKWGYDIRVTVDRNGATGNCYFTRGNGFFEEEE